MKFPRWAFFFGAMFLSFHLVSGQIWSAFDSEYLFRHLQGGKQIPIGSHLFELKLVAASALLDIFYLGGEKYLMAFTFNLVPALVMYRVSSRNKFLFLCIFPFMFALDRILWVAAYLAIGLLAVQNRRLLLLALSTVGMYQLRPELAIAIFLCVGVLYLMGAGRFLLGTSIMMVVCFFGAMLLSFLVGLTFDMFAKELEWLLRHNEIGSGFLSGFESNASRGAIRVLISPVAALTADPIERAAVFYCYLLFPISIVMALINNRLVPLLFVGVILALLVNVSVTINPRHVALCAITIMIISAQGKEKYERS